MVTNIVYWQHQGTGSMPEELYLLLLLPLTDPNITLAPGGYWFYRFHLVPRNALRTILLHSQSIARRIYASAYRKQKLLMVQRQCQFFIAQVSRIPSRYCQAISGSLLFQPPVPGPILRGLQVLRRFCSTSLADSRYYRRLVLPPAGCRNWLISTSQWRSLVGANASP